MHLVPGRGAWYERGMRKNPGTTLSLTRRTRGFLEWLAYQQKSTMSAVANNIIEAEIKRSGYVQPQRNTPMRITLVTADGAELPIATHNGQLYAAAEPDTEYQIRINNDSPNRRLVVITVDGVNIITGEDGSYDDDGYVIGPYQTSTIPGWRRSGYEVAAFKFGTVEAAYATKTRGDKQNVGIIGVATFDERVRPTWTYDNSSLLRSRPISNIPYGSNTTGGNTMGGAIMDSFTTTNCSTAGLDAQLSGVTLSEAQPQDVGTEYGKKTAFNTMTTTFDRATTEPAEVLTIRYATKATLRSWGVPIDAPQPAKPEAFPAEIDGVPPPVGWRG